ncbi:MAG: O-antigen ligase domain-containing protein, partial [Isosphaeraceae bacterium]
MTILAYLALLGWIPAVLVMFAMMPSRHAATAAVVGSWLILPPYKFDIVGLPDYSKNMAASIGMTLGALIFAPQQVLSFRPRWFDMPIILFSLCGLVTSLYNGLGLYDGLSSVLAGTITWALPYLLGRILLSDYEGMRIFCVGMIVGSLAYVPPCLYEMRMSPVLLGKIYGIMQYQGIRLGGYRPSVFFWTGLECGLWMAAAALTAWWLWNRGTIREVAGLPAGPVVVPGLLVMAVLCRSTGAILLMVAGMAILWLSVRFRTRLLLIGLMLVGPAYAALRIPNYWTGQNAVNLAATWIDPERAHSLWYRFMCENLLIARAVQQPVFGWGGWGRNEVYFDPARTKRVEMDGLWVITLGTRGFVGLSLLFASLLMPAIVFTWRFPPKTWGDPRVAVGSLTATFLGLYVVDCMLNGFVNIIYLTLAGGLVGLDPRQLRTAGVPRAASVAVRRPPT